jgi:hypothetical protein
MFLVAVLAPERAEMVTVLAQELVQYQSLVHIDDAIH